jgi:sugar fermentation stimulation protein A
MQCGRRRWIVETKSATLRRGAVAMFPDALTERGTRHLRELGDVARDGPADLRPAVAFVCQRPDVFSFTPNAEGDPDFAEALHAAREAGVLVVAYRCEVGPRAIAIAERIPVRLGRRGR